MISAVFVWPQENPINLIQTAHFTNCRHTPDKILKAISVFYLRSLYESLSVSFNKDPL